ncbi:MAG: SDR family NAD(P)-dependent oxidoreductase [Rhodospirillaceae bacterium]|nr:SDR family NAD(P)-dependent oxidoreductase [Rhodospirillaceae bacterium]
MANQTALIVGAGYGLSASLARLFTREGMTVTLAARSPDKLSDLLEETGATAHACDVSDAGQVAALFEELETRGEVPDIVVYNPSSRVRGAVVDLDPDAVLKATTITCHGGFLVAQQAARRMLQKGGGTILFTGASASVKGFANSSCFAMGKFGLRGLAEAMARELHPKGIHIGHFVIDGGIRQPNDPREERGADGFLDPDAIAETYLHFIRQPRNSWAWEIELRPWVEKF